MSEEDAKLAADEDAAYMAALILRGVPLAVATRMVCSRIASRLIGEAMRPKIPKEPWQE